MAQVCKIVTFHSISEGNGPTFIAPHIFRAQMEALEDAGCRVIPLNDVKPWLCRKIDLPPRSIVLTFDDGFENFDSIVFPELQRRNWNATVFLPVAKIGCIADWDRQAGGQRLMSWDSVTRLAQQGIDFGAHGVRHVDLTKVSLDEARREILGSKAEIESRINRPVRSFAAPFGRTNPEIRTEISRHFEIAVGTSLANVRRGQDVYDLPRIEMWYFRNIKRWREFLLGRSRAYFFLRQTLRQSRSVFSLSRRFAQGLTGFKKAK